MTGFCDCREDGFCPRYQRHMGGRLREVCAGINVDLGTAAVFREQWLREATISPPVVNSKPEPLLLITDQMPGDALVMTAAVYSLHRAYPGKYTTAIASPWPEVFEHNPDVVAAISGMSELRMHYPAIHRSNERGIHFMQGWCEFLGMALETPIPLLTNRPLLYFAKPLPSVGDFWLVCSGGKNDFTNKLWGHDRYQEVIDRLRGRVRFVQVGSLMDNHPPLEGTTNLVGRTTLRQLFDLTRRARGVLCGVSLLMHVAAALERPAVVVAGGREPVAWNAYPKQQYVHTVGALPCHDTFGNVGGACWRSRVYPFGDGTAFDQHTCERPSQYRSITVPECMDLITPAEVAALVLRYNNIAG